MASPEEIAADHTSISAIKKVIDKVDAEAELQFYNAARAAKYLGISVSVFRRRVKEGHYTASRVDEKGWKYFSMKDLKAFKSRGLMAMPPGDENTVMSNVFDVGTSTRVFAALNQGKLPTEIVASGIHAHHVKSLYALWLELGGCVHLTREQVSEIESLRLEGQWPLGGGKDLVENLRLMSKQRAPICSRCKQLPRSSYCSPCATAIYEERMVREIEQEKAKKEKKMGRPRKEARETTADRRPPTADEE